MGKLIKGVIFKISLHKKLLEMLNQNLIMNMDCAAFDIDLDALSSQNVERITNKYRTKPDDN